MSNWSEVVEKLKAGVVEVTFLKVNGEVRIMQATLAEYLLPEVTGTSTRQKDPNIQVVYDLEAEAWRSFKIDSVIEVVAYDN